MNDRCRVFEDFCETLAEVHRSGDERKSNEPHTEFEEHLAICTECREQWDLHVALEETLTPIARPALSTAFADNLRRSIGRERAQTGRVQTLMRIYWLAACIIAVLVFLSTNVGGAAGGATLAMLLLCFALPTLFLGRVLPVNLFVVILSTMKKPEGRIAVWMLLTGCLFLGAVFGQSVERERPEEWNGLVLGGRFMDRFLPMPAQGQLTSDTWGADNVKPRYIDNGIEDNEWSYWGGNALRGDDGRYHLYICRWREDSEGGHREWPRSIVVHAVSEKPTGPYRVKDTVGPGHNPEVFQLANGRYVIYVINGYYTADALDGPWQAGKFEFDRRDRRIIEGLSNLTFSRREDGSYLMVCRGGGVWFSRTGISPYRQVTDARVYPAVEGRFEDPVVWRTNVQYHLIVNDWLGRIAYYLRSGDGISWKVEPGEAYLPGIAGYEDGTTIDWFKYERIKVLQDQHGRATQAHFAVIDVLKKKDLGSDEHSSKHICIPLTVGRLLTILDHRPITAGTKAIRVKIAAEKGFDPHEGIDLYSLRFGASEEVNFGRGCRPIKAERSGLDLIVTFDGAGNGITDRNFAAKLLGKTSDGQLLFGWARLPWLNYLEPALSARPPVFASTGNGFEISVEVQNFGQVASRSSEVGIVCGKNDDVVKVAGGKIPPLDPFEKTTVALPCGRIFEDGVSYDIRVVITPPGQSPVILERQLVPAPR